jgi:hypothetical protein
MKMVLLSLSVSVAGAVGVLPSTPAQADQVSTLKAQAKLVAQELVQEQLQAGAYQQQYSVATQRVVDDERTIALTQEQITSDKQAIRNSIKHVQRLAVLSYVLTGTSSTSGAGMLAENLSTIQATNEYATITIGNIDVAVDHLHTVQRALQVQQAQLLQQRSRDQAEQALQATDLSNANSTLSHMRGVQAQVTGQLATAVAQQNAISAAAAAAAVAAAQRTAAQKAPAFSSPSNETDPALNPFLQCVLQAESGGDYAAVSPNGLYMGGFQFSQPTWDYAAQAAGRGDLVGVHPNVASKANQDTVAVALYSLDGERPWLGDRCSST